MKAFRGHEPPSIREVAPMATKRGRPVSPLGRVEEQAVEFQAWDHEEARAISAVYDEQREIVHDIERVRIALKNGALDVAEDVLTVIQSRAGVSMAHMLTWRDGDRRENAGHRGILGLFRAAKEPVAAGPVA